MKIGETLCNFIVLYCSLSQSEDDFEKFLKNFELNLDTILATNTFLTVVLGDVNVKSNIWCKSDKTSYEGSKTEGVTSQFGLQQVIDKSTHYTRNSSSCVDLIFALQPNLVMEHILHYTKIVIIKQFMQTLKFIIHLLEREIWHYQKASIENIRKAIDQFPWAKRFTNIGVNEKVNLFNKTIKNIIRNYIPYETINCNDREGSTLD